MSSKDEVNFFLQEFKVKAGIFQIVFRNDRFKNTQTLLDLEISPAKRKEIVLGLVVTDYVQGPVDDRLYGLASLWVFGKLVKGVEIYIKISMGVKNNPVICISFHPAEYPLKYPLK
ncbi:hypothetical protein [Pedobacter faecalis]|uniref:hypothetical protein n=1 Tax=Pedobacter faecalis TaxID=3041495 RepID=UPI002550EC47|nr:hypothetical protein [Pedobacter sp. ELA7]